MMQLTRLNRKSSQLITFDYCKRLKYTRLIEITVGRKGLFRGIFEESSDRNGDCGKKSHLIMTGKGLSIESFSGFNVFFKYVLVLELWIYLNICDKQRIKISISLLYFSNKCEAVRIVPITLLFLLKYSLNEVCRESYSRLIIYL